MSPRRPLGDGDAARRTAAHLDALLAADERRAPGVPADAALDPGVRLAARRLAAESLRVHPSFRFEERLAARLATAARSPGAAPAAADSRPAEPIPLPLAPLGGSSLAVPATGALEPGLVELLAGLPGAARARLPGRASRQVLIGGAVTSALSLAGAVLVAWRLAHPSAGPMARAVRAANADRARRAATTAAAVAGGLGTGGFGGLGGGLA